MVVFGQSGCLRAMWLYLGKDDFIRTKVVVFVQMWLYSDKSICIFSTLLYSGKVIVFGQKWLYLG